MSFRLGCLVLLCFIAPLGVQASLKDVKPCLGVHIRDAMILNDRRASFYEKLSQGRSREISQRLIAMEKKLAVVAPLADLVASVFQISGVPILCEDFIDMAEAPAMRGYNPEGLHSGSSLAPPPLNEIESVMRDLLRKRAYEDLALFADQHVRRLAAMPHFNCLMKHMLESIRRVAALTPQHKAVSVQRLGLSSEFLSRRILSSHINLLKESAQIDLLAVPLQMEGLPIVCQDVPEIPWP